MIPFLYTGSRPFEVGEWLYIPDIKTSLQKGEQAINAYVLKRNTVEEIKLETGELTSDERKILLAGCLMNYYKIK